jgi:hypothetical protein
MVQLLARQGEAGDPAAGRRQMLRQCSPAATDFQNIVLAIEVQQGGDALQLGLLGGLKAGAARDGDGRGIGHALIEPQAVEIIAQIVMEGDVAAAAMRRVAMQEMAEFAPHPHRPEAFQRAVEPGDILRGQRDQLRQVRAGPVARDIALGKTDIPARQQAAERHAIAHLDHPMRTGQRACMIDPDARGQDDRQPSALQMPQRAADQPGRGPLRLRRDRGQSGLCLLVQIHAPSPVWDGMEMGWSGGAGQVCTGTPFAHSRAASHECRPPP